MDLRNFFCMCETIKRSLSQVIFGKKNEEDHAENEEESLATPRNLTLWE